MGSESTSYLSLEELQRLFSSQDTGKYSTWALRTTRNWTNAQLVAIKAALSILLTNLVWTEVRSLDQNPVFNWPRYLLIILLVGIIYIIFKFERMNNEVEDIREERKNRYEKAQVAQILALQYLFNEIIPETDDVDKQINLIKIIPKMMAYIDADEVTKEISTGFQLVADLTTSIMDKIDRVRDDVRQSIDIDALLANIRDVPRPKPVTMASELIPNDRKFPTNDL